MVAGKVRIIAGRLRGSKLDVRDAPGLRPTSDRVRETLFNWLQPALPGARVLDLFAGTGALGFEAASRGAQCVQLIERDPAQAQALREAAVRLRTDNLDVHAGDALGYLRLAPPTPFDVVLVDPPFDAGLHPPVLALLPPWLAPQAWVYVESSAHGAPLVPQTWRLHREGHTREVRYALYATLPA